MIARRRKPLVSCFLVLHEISGLPANPSRPEVVSRTTHAQVELTVIRTVS